MDENKQQPPEERFGTEETPPSGAQPQYYPQYHTQQGGFGAPGYDAPGVGEAPPADAQPQYYPPYDPRPQYYVSPTPDLPDPAGISAARTAMILGILSLVVPCGGTILGIIAILKSLTARRLGCFTGEAIAGLVCGILSLAGVVLGFVIYFIMFAFMLPFTLPF